ncbi:apoptotic chromatin condensation inducer in the nucleus isoform X3 [Halyomorpha halys]|uniref:apoptotic chromatin condensation inducer in the nucleus isoform X3 n=1 Tax=Halyomorpha halys TaxID=286706 RepID=UPI0006D501CF|nr:apoptotic chromatin condensation inducer in the nucleus isoform X3 [Halyomorpha halys]
MVRKSERNKAQGTPEKLIPERTRKSTRQALRRKKKSSSESEGEPEVVVDKDIKEVGELSESKLQTEPEGPEAKEDGARSRRSVRRHPAALQSDKEQERGEQNNEWEEDPSFWHSEGPAPQETTELKVTADDGITWKIQSSNGSGGEIQKLKICRQRVTESNDSSSPTKEASPRRRKSTRSSRNLDTPSDSSESFEVNNEVAEVKTTSEEPVIPGLENSKGTEVNNDNLTEPVPEEQAVNEKEIPDPVSSGGDVSANPEDPSIETVQCNNIEPVLQKTSSPEGVVTDCDKQNMDVDKEDVQCESAVPADEPEECNKLSEEPSDKSSAELEPTNIVEDQVERTTQESTKPDEEKITEEIISAVNSEGSPVLDKEGSTSIEKEGSIALEAEVSTALVSEGSTLLENEENTTLETEGSTSVDVEENNADDNEESTTLINEGNTAVDKEGASELVIEEITALNREDSCEEGNIKLDKEGNNMDESNIQESSVEEINVEVSLTQSDETSEKEIPSISENSDDTKQETISVTPTEIESIEKNETNSDEVLKKLNERAARFSKELNDSKKKDENVNPEPKSPREEGELTPVLETKKSKHTTIVINRPKEVTSQPTKLKRNTVVRKISLLTEDVKKARRSPSPSGNPATEVLFITNLVRPFTIPQLRELLARTGTIASNGFYIDKIKSKCYVKYTDIEMAVETRHALNGVRWPVNNPKMLKVEFATPEDMALVQKLAEDEVTVKKPETAEPVTAATAGWLSEQAALKPQRRVTTAVREWDMGKVGMGAAEEKRQVEEWPVKPELPEVKRRAASPVENKYEPPARKIKKRDNDAPARLLDDLFRKTKATPCIYWLPLTAAQIAVKEEMRRQHMAEHERRLAELRKSDHSRRDKDREKSRDSRRKK